MTTPTGILIVDTQQTNNVRLPYALQDVGSVPTLKSNGKQNVLTWGTLSSGEAPFLVETADMTFLPNAVATGTPTANNLLQGTGTNTVGYTNALSGYSFPSATVLDTNGLFNLGGASPPANLFAVAPYTQIQSPPTGTSEILIIQQQTVSTNALATGGITIATFPSNCTVSILGAVFCSNTVQGTGGSNLALYVNNGSSSFLAATFTGSQGLINASGTPTWVYGALSSPECFGPTSLSLAPSGAAFTAVTPTGPLMFLSAVVMVHSF